MIRIAQADGGKTPSEDRVLIKQLDAERQVLAVFDGHGGAQVAEKTEHFFREAFDTCPMNIQEITSWLREKFLELDNAVLRYKNVGSTVSIALVTPTYIVGAYVGDSPIILFTPEGRIIHSSVDHSPSLQRENRRIRDTGGSVQTMEGDVPRVNGILAVSRAIGDHGLKPYVSGEPDIFAWARPEHAYLALMSDGMVESPYGKNVSRKSVVRRILDADFQAEKIVQQQNLLMEGHGDNLSIIIMDVSKGRPLPPINLVQKAGATKKNNTRRKNIRRRAYDMF